MKIGVYIDGQAEAIAQKKILSKLSFGNITFIGPIYVDIQPRATALQIARKIIDKSSLTHGKTQYNVVLIDKDDRNQCPTTFASDIQNALNSFNKQSYMVVVKNIQFENWLIASPSSFFH